jgi:hypothetical protein
MQISSAFPSEFLRAPDLQGRTVKVVIDRVEFRDIGSDNKPVAFFFGKKRGLVLNKTNSLEIANYYGDETDHWQGREIEIYPTKALYQGRQVDAIRVRIPRTVQPVAQQHAPRQLDHQAPPDRQPVPAPARQLQPEAGPQLIHEREPGEDEIPF